MKLPVNWAALNAAMPPVTPNTIVFFINAPLQDVTIYFHLSLNHYNANRKTPQELLNEK